MDKRTIDGVKDTVGLMHFGAMSRITILFVLLAIAVFFAYFVFRYGHTSLHLGTDIANVVGYWIAVGAYLAFLMLVANDLDKPEQGWSAQFARVVLGKTQTNIEEKWFNQGGSSSKNHLHAEHGMHLNLFQARESLWSASSTSHNSIMDAWSCAIPWNMEPD